MSKFALILHGRNSASFSTLSYTTIVPRQRENHQVLATVTYTGWSLNIRMDEAVSASYSEESGLSLISDPCSPFRLYSYHLSSQTTVFRASIPYDIVLECSISMIWCLFHIYWADIRSFCRRLSRLTALGRHFNSPSNPWNSTWYLN